MGCIRPLFRHTSLVALPRAFGITLALAALSAFSSAADETRSLRSIFLNGMDISSARSQELKNVDIHINEKGDVFIIAPHYQVHEEDTYVPLSKYVQGMNPPTHKAPQSLSGEPTGMDVPASPVPAQVRPLSVPPSATATPPLTEKSGAKHEDEAPMLPANE